MVLTELLSIERQHLAVGPWHLPSEGWPGQRRPGPSGPAGRFAGAMDSAAVGMEGNDGLGGNRES